MAFIRPTTRTPGSLKLLYVHRGLSHRCSVNLVSGVDINDIIERRIDATALALLTRACLPDTAVIQGWALYTRPGSPGPPTLIYTEAFAAPYTGTLGAITGSKDWNSMTITATGQGTQGGPGYAVGQCKFILFVGKTLFPDPDDKSYTFAPGNPHKTLQTGLASSAHLWADFYGQKASVRAAMPIQWNAAVQRRHGA